MKKLFAVMTAVVFLLIVAGHSMARQSGPPSAPPPGKPFQVSYEDGTYRGMYADGGGMQVALEFTLDRNVVSKIGFRTLFYSNTNYLNNVAVEGLREQYQDLLEHLKGEDIRIALKDLYEPGAIVQYDALKANGVDVATGATVRSGKVISAIRDGLNRGVYRY
jgi:uncharacterized protein with FMN-binding domain